MSSATSLRLAGQAVKSASSTTVRRLALSHQCRGSLSQASSAGLRPSCIQSPAMCFRKSVIPAARNYASTGSEAQATLGKTGLYDLHLQHGAKMVPFGGFYMPVQYSDLGVGESHKWTREKASIFDVSHMVQYHLTGPGANEFLEKITPAAIKDLPPHQSTLSALLHPKTGGICDDTIITRLEANKFYIVTNAGCREKDAAFFSSELAAWNSGNQPRAELSELKNQGLIALQGPLAADILQSVLANPSEVNLEQTYFGSSRYVSIALPNGPSKPVLASRGGYTGEDGFEISIAPEDTVAVTEHLLRSAGPEKLRLAGLGARDSLRLEAGMCLYGHDLDDSTTPVEAALGWIIGKARRETGGFNGAEAILPQLKPKTKGGRGVDRRRVGLVVEGAPAREGAEIVTVDGNGGEVVGKVTSGCPSPTLGRNIAMGYVRDGLHKSGTELGVKVRGKVRKATVSKMPFVPSKYWKGGASPA